MITQDLGAILDTIRDVETSLARRAARARGAIIMIWGLAGATIFAFYQVVERNPAAFGEALGAALSWVWLIPIVIGYAATAVVGARLGRAGVKGSQRTELHRPGIIGLATVVLAVVLVLAGRFESIPGMLTLAVGAATFVSAFGGEPSPTRPLARAVGGAMALVGLALAVWPVAWANGVAALAMLLGFGLLGTVTYRTGR